MQATGVAIAKPNAAVEALRAHWPEYLMEAAALGMFMVSACAFGVLLQHAPVGEFGRQALGGVAMGLTAVAIICSPWGQRSGAHMNPAFTLAFWTLGKIGLWDAVFYMAAQFVGGTAGVALSRLAIGSAVADVQYVVTVPGLRGPLAAFAGEFAISFLLVWIVLRASNSRRWTRITPWVAGCLVAAFIAIESPLSGMSMNPARSFASALPAGVWTSFWIYLIAPPMAMIAAAQLYRGGRIFCAKYHHHNGQRCIFRCKYGALQNEQ